ncbi:hypothetical protein AB0C81_26675 [Streptomyces roseoverticillatus]|uniref:hypothetical protein n=1 Tax=Streptomyces roseoverticillatus TaxID=66429 RepID=UPI0033F380B6
MSTDTCHRTAAPTIFKRDDFVLFRDPTLFWMGKPGHTFVCRVADAFHTGAEYRYTLICLSTGQRINGSVRGDYMRLLPPADAMRDIDIAPLNAMDAADDMTPAAVAWLTSRTTTTNQRPEVPYEHR